ncbi:FMN reductase [Streptomyces sp. 2114.2]|nr:FMN reductase [Streptomyces sp. 2114.2]
MRAAPRRPVPPLRAARPGRGAHPSPGVPPRPPSRKENPGGRPTAQGHEMVPLDVRVLPVQALLGADLGHPAITESAGLFARPDVVVGAPVRKASYSGALNAS